MREGTKPRTVAPECRSPEGGIVTRPERNKATLFLGRTVRERSEILSEKDARNQIILTGDCVVAERKKRQKTDMFMLELSGYSWSRNRPPD